MATKLEAFKGRDENEFYGRQGLKIRASVGHKPFKQEIKEYIKYYNNQIIKLNLNGMSPTQYRAHYD